MKIHHLANSTQCLLEETIRDLSIEFGGDEGSADPGGLEEILCELIEGLGQRLNAVRAI